MLFVLLRTTESAQCRIYWTMGTPSCTTSLKSTESDLQQSTAANSSSAVGGTSKFGILSGSAFANIYSSWEFMCVACFHAYQITCIFLPRVITSDLNNFSAPHSMVISKLWGKRSMCWSYIPQNRGLQSLFLCLQTNCMSLYWLSSTARGSMPDEGWEMW